MIKFVKGKDSKYVYDSICSYPSPSITRIVLLYVKSGELKYISNQYSIIYGILKKLELR